MDDTRDTSVRRVVDERELPVWMPARPRAVVFYSPPLDNVVRVRCERAIDAALAELPERPREVVVQLWKARDGTWRVRVSRRRAKGDFGLAFLVADALRSAGVDVMLAS